MVHVANRGLLVLSHSDTGVPQKLQNDRLQGRVLFRSDEPRLQIRDRVCVVSFVDKLFRSGELLAGGLVQVSGSLQCIQKRPRTISQKPCRLELSRQRMMIETITGFAHRRVCRRGCASTSYTAGFLSSCWRPVFTTRVCNVP